ncbi:DMSO reductase anchor subunit [Paraburkholderia graminis]|uniref:DMSO reductase anchor subunit n=1 Tax=Paraburkholderia graminis TaxID=60548 RepID=A0ABD5C7P6_9BURK|nr:DMSO reductase anchor subunit [Paraburkholderia graminis]
MNPAFSVVILTILCGAAQGLLIALTGVELAVQLGVVSASTGPPPMFYMFGAALSVVLCALGLLSSFFHLGHPERAWRAIAMWRTSWLSRECLCLPVFLACAFCYGIAHWLGSPWSIVIGLFGVLASAALFVCTAMILRLPAMPAGMGDATYDGELRPARLCVRLYAGYRKRRMAGA